MAIGGGSVGFGAGGAAGIFRGGCGGGAVVFVGFPFSSRLVAASGGSREDEVASLLRPERGAAARALGLLTTTGRR